MRDRLSVIHTGMVQRCYNPNCKDFKRYGGNGITICDEWYTPNSSKGLKAFKEWALSNGYNDTLSIDRINNKSGYSSENCRWVTMKVQQNNRSDNINVSYKGKTQTLKQWCEELSVNYTTVVNRINLYHWDVIKALEYRANASERLIAYNGKTQSLTKWCKDLGLNYWTIKSRLAKGWSIENAFETKIKRRIKHGSIE